jgi:hypothetical protein
VRGKIEMMSTEAARELVREFGRSAAVDRLGYLAGRWSDEKEYEDFKEYEVEMKKMMPDKFTFVKGTKRPFGVNFKIADRPETFFVRVSVSANTVKWGAIK